jgi:hypothetical protein
MTYLVALDILASDPHCWRYRELTANDFHDPQVRDAWRDRIVSMAGGQPEPIAAAPASPPDPWLPLIRACDDHNPGCCTSPAPYCTRFAKNVSRDECIDCLTAAGITPEGIVNG